MEISPALSEFIRKTQELQEKEVTSLKGRLRDALSEERELLRELYLYPEGRPQGGAVVLLGETTDRFSDLICDE